MPLSANGILKFTYPFRTIFEVGCAGPVPRFPSGAVPGGSIRNVGRHRAARHVNILGVETSCDETSAALVKDGVVASNVISSQLIHSQYGGVVPELASRAHQRMIIEVVDEALRRGACGRGEIDAVAATLGPGLVGALLVGLNFGKALSYALEVPFIGINHMEGHLYSNFLTDRKPEYPFVCLIVSGGHTMLVHVEAPFKHTLLGQTRDDAAGEAFDKVAKMLNLGYPGGPVIDRRAKEGDPHAIEFPRSYLDSRGYEFSFSGIKTAVLYYLRRRGLLDAEMNRRPIEDQHLVNICAGFQAAVIDVLVNKTITAAEKMGVRDVTIAGGVSANSRLREQLHEETRKRGLRLFYPGLDYCMDNGAMIAYVGWMKIKEGIRTSLDATAVANLELA
jgi:N6-L-threonylcarbamoyladenine synthase